MELKNNLKLLKIILFLTALHSFCVGAGLIFIPAGFFAEFGYAEITENFFRAQGGVFHWVMVAAYLSAFLNPVKYKIMVQFSITAKFIATIFLISYYIFVDPIIVVLLSGAGDFAMGLCILFLAHKNNLLNHKE